ncbi:protein gp37 [Yoonia maricola]|uniref:Protein gp37 n=1 Tax=Yoonia maricola TaxID=420999 RepID=A0A2M8WNI7_9RHOB|nr:phage Gp37/Gp68 family protein [Yoonia maricola]PJI92490.1 protein gp37 [Yoonia maricola]
MGANSKIEWTTHTFNPWWGCTKVSEACKHCYAEAWAKRVGQKVWGPRPERRLLSDTHWRQPLKWNRDAAKSNERPRVFCASMADVFEDRDELIPHRDRLFDLIEATPNLDWLLLTKRPQNVRRLARWDTEWPDNVWLGTTVELQKRAEELLPYIEAVPAKVRFISAEPLLGPLEIEPWLETTIDWVITGGESGPKARPASPKWFTDLHAQCMRTETAFHFKQWGDWAPGDGINLLTKSKPAESVVDDGTPMFRVGKKTAGRRLNGELHDGLPKVVRSA